MLLCRGSVAKLATIPMKGRSYSSTTKQDMKEPKPKRKVQQEFPKFRNIVLVAIVGTYIFVKTVQTLDKNKPKTNYTEAEYENVMSGLRRKVTLYQPGEIDIQCALVNTVADAKRLTNKDGGDEATFVDAKDAVDYFRKLKDDRYEALLTDLYNQYGEKSYVDNLPAGMQSMLLGRYIKEVLNSPKKVIVVNFPKNIEDAIKFESEISVLSKLWVPKVQEDTDLCKYFKGVNKVIII